VQRWPRSRPDEACQGIVAARSLRATTGKHLSRVQSTDRSWIYTLPETAMSQLSSRTLLPGRSRVAPKTKAPSPERCLANTPRRHHAERRNWKASTLPEWLNQEVYDRMIQPLLKPFSRSTIMSAIGVSKMYASDIRSGKRRPHPRHWVKLAELVGVSAEG